jgi:hypothetical protein
MNDASSSTATAIPAAQTNQRCRLKNPLLFAVSAIVTLNNVPPHA